jgi:hypothetical protein
MALCSAPPQPSVLSTALCLLCSPFSHYVHLSPLRHSNHTTALCLLYSSLSPQWPSVAFTALCPFYGPLKNRRNESSCFVKCFAKRFLSKPPRVFMIYVI